MWSDSRGEEITKIGRLERERKEAMNSSESRVVVPNSPCSVVRVSVHSPGSPGEEARDQDRMFDCIQPNGIESRRGCLRYGEHLSMVRDRETEYLREDVEIVSWESMNPASIRTDTSMTSGDVSNKSKIE